MHVSTSALFFVSLLIPAAWTTLHTACYRKIISGKPKCVPSAADNRHRCRADATKPKRPVAKIKLAKHTLGRRYDTPLPVFWLDSGEGICGNYDTNVENGACLWSGTSSDGSKPEESGWLNGAKSSNCNKRLYVRRAGRMETTQFVTVRDGCSFDTRNSSIGCYQIGLTFKTWSLFNPTPKENQQGALDGMEWDFDNAEGQSPQQGPV